MTTSVLKLPKGLKDHPLEAKISTWFAQNQGPIRPGGTATVAALGWTPAVQTGLAAVLVNEHLLQGLDLIERAMRKELNGLKAVAQKSNNPMPERMSRLLLLASDGSERFYRQAESILLEHRGRMTACILTADSVVLGAAVSKKNLPVKGLLITDRKSLEGFLIQVFGN